MSRTRQPRRVLAKRVDRALGQAIAKRGRAMMEDVLVELSMLTPRAFRDWRAGRIPFLEKAVHGNLTKLARIQTGLRRSTAQRGLERGFWPPPQGRRYPKTGRALVEREYGAVYSPKG